MCLTKALLLFFSFLYYRTVGPPLVIGSQCSLKKYGSCEKHQKNQEFRNGGSLELEFLSKGR
jgi:hypothetical protein